MKIIDNPQEIIVYASQTAYKTPSSRLKYIDMKIDPPSSWWDKLYIATDGRDEFSFFEVPHKYYKKGKSKERMVWPHFSFVEIPKDIWASNDNGLDLPSEFIDRLNNATDEMYISEYTDYNQFFNSPTRDLAKGLNRRTMRYGWGLASGPNVDGRVSPEFFNTYNFDHSVPYRFENGVWEPDFENQGRFIFFHPDTVEYGRTLIKKGKFIKWDYATKQRHQEMVHPPRIWSQPIRLGKEVVGYEYVGSGLHVHNYGPFVLYLPSMESIYLPLQFLNETYKIK